MYLFLGFYLFLIVYGFSFFYTCTPLLHAHLIPVVIGIVVKLILKLFNFLGNS